MATEQPHWEDFYLGSRRFQFIADGLGMPIDQVNFVLGQIFALVLAWGFRVALHPSKVSSETRHWASLIAGLGISYFCFGKQVLLALALVVGCYLLMLLLPITLLHHVTLASSITFLSVMHITRQFYEDGVFVIDVTGPMMICVQKATSLAYSLHDGLSGCKDEDLTPLQKEMVVRKKPSALEYFGYMLNFHSVLAGPYFMFADYQDFIEGTNYATRASHTVKLLDSNSNSHGEEKVVKSPSKPEDEPDPTPAATSKALMSVLCACVTVYILPRVPISYVTEPGFFQLSFVSKSLYLVVVTMATRHIYYTGWLLGDAICNMSGMGFNGYEQDGTAKWNLVSNVDILGVECGFSLRDTLEAWNSGTMKWLRFMVYERAPGYKTMLTYMLSSVWHGFYPGYYVTFIGGAFFTIAARNVRRSLRPRVLAMGPQAKVAYDALTFVVTRLNLAYFTFPFILLRFWGAVTVYRHLYFYQTILGLLAIVALPVLVPPPRRARQEKKEEKEEKKLIEKKEEKEELKVKEEVEEERMVNGVTDEKKNEEEEGDTGHIKSQ